MILKINEKQYNLIISESSVKKDERVKLYDDGKILVVVPLSHTASCKYGANTPWCVSTPSNDENFNDYTRYGILFIFIIKSPYDYADLKEYKFAYYHSFSNKMNQENGWYDMSDYKFEKKKSKDDILPDMRLIKFLIPDKVMSYVFNYIKGQKVIYNQNEKKLKKEFFNLLLDDNANTIIVNDKEWVIFCRNENFNSTYDKFGWLPGVDNKLGLFLIYVNKRNYKCFRQIIDYHYDIRKYLTNTKKLPDIKDIDDSEDVDLGDVFLKYLNNIFKYYFMFRKKYFNDTYIYLYPNYVDVGDYSPILRSPEEIISKTKQNGKYRFSTKNYNNLFYGEDLGLSVVYDKEKHNPINFTS
jgi:hypothetical protein